MVTLCTGMGRHSNLYYCIRTRPIVPSDYNALETLFKNAVKEKQPFERLVLSKEKLLEMFAVSW